MTVTINQPMDEKTNIINYLDKNGILWMPINLKLDENKKKILLPYRETNKKPSYTDFTKTDDTISNRKKLIDYYEYIWIDTRNIQQIDVDGDVDPKLNTPCFLSVGKKKRHYFIKGFGNMKLKRSSTRWENVELLCGQASYAHKNSRIYFANESILNVSGRQNEIVPSVDNCSDKEYKNVPNSVSDSLSRVMGVDGKWNIHTYRSSQTAIVCVPASDKKCLVDVTKTHSCVQCWLVISRTQCTAKCYSCSPSRKIDTKLNAGEWKVIREGIGIKPPEDTKYDDLLDHLEDTCSQEGYLKKDGYIMRRSPDCPIEYEQVNIYEEFLDNLFRKSDDQLRRLYRRPNVKDNLVKYLTNNHVTIPLLKRNQNIVAFKNGFLRLDSMSFEEYDQYPRYTFAAKKYIPFDLDPEILNKNWYDVKCPVFDKIISDQPQLSGDISLIFHGFLGRLHYPIGSDPSDKIHAIPYLVGTSGTGKSTIVNIISNTFSQECIGTLNFKEKIFGKTAFLDKDIIIDSDTPSNMISEFGKTDFQKAVSGETIAIPVKNQKQESQKKITQPMLFCSQYMQDVQDTGEVIRRIAYFGFEPVEQTNGDMESECINTELHLVLIKLLLARKEMLNKYGKIPFHEWNLPYFDSMKEDILIENNPIYRMISQSDSLVYRKGSKYSFVDFLEEYNAFYASQHRKPKKPKSTDVIFTKMNTPIKKECICKGCRKKFDPKKVCCPDYSTKNKISCYYVMNLYKKRTLHIDDSDSEDPLERNVRSVNLIQ